MADSIASLMAQLGGMNYNAPSSYKGYQPSSTPIAYKPINLTPYNFNTNDFQSLVSPSKPKSSVLNTLGNILSGTLGQVGGVVTNSAYNTLKDLTDKKQSVGEKALDVLFKDTIGASLGQGIVNGAKHQWKDWTDGTLDSGDFGAGFLHGMDTGWKRGSDIMDLAGVHNRWGNIGGGLAIDVALDPLTYFTGGLSVASKISKLSELEKMAELGKTIGVAGKFKNADEFLAAAKPALEAKYAQYPNLAERMVNKKMNDFSKALEDTRNTAFNDNINKIGFKAPFMNKYALTDMSTKNPLYRSEAVLGDQYKHVADNLLSEHGVSQADQPKVLEKMFGKTNTADLTKSELSKLGESLQTATGKLSDWEIKLKNFPSFITHEVGVLGHAPQVTTDVMGDNAGLPSLFRQSLAPSTELKPKEVLRYIRDVEMKVGNQNAGKKSILDFIGKETTHMDGKTNLEHFFDKHNPFNARTLKTDNPFVNSAAEHIADANSQKIGETARYARSLSKIQDFIKKNKMSKSDMEQAIYHIEGHAPDHLGGKDWVPSDTVKNLANLVRPVIDRIGSEEQKAGVLKELRDNYFPHVLNHDDKIAKEMEDFAKRHPELNDLKQTNKFDQKRTSFQTLAQRDNYIKKLEKAIQNETDSATIESLRAHQERVANLFDTDVVSALTRRIREGVRSKAMKDLQGKLSKMGMMKSSPTKIENLEGGLKQVPKDVAKKLGLSTDETHYIHPDVLNGMKRVDDIFTSEGMQKWQRHLTAISDIWRPLVTYYKPSHYMNNIIGNSINNMAAGVKVSDYKTAAKLIKGYRSGKLTDAQMKIMEQAYKHNVISGGFLYDSHRTFSFDNPTFLENAAKKVGENKFIKKTRSGGEIIDDVSRLANFIGGMNKYGNTTKAAAQVRKYLFNYNELTNADRAMRVAVPFWNWTKNNVPLQMKLLMENPKFAMNIERFKQLFDKNQKGQDWQKDTGIKIGNHYTSIASPTQDLEQITHPLQFLGSMNPLPQTILEMAMNKKMYTGKPISYGSNELQAKDVPSYLAHKLGIVGNAYDLASGKDNILESIIKLIKPYTDISPVGQGGS